MMKHVRRQNYSWYTVTSARRPLLSFIVLNSGERIDMSLEKGYVVVPKEVMADAAGSLSRDVEALAQRLRINVSGR